MQYDIEPGNYVVNPSQKSWGIGQVQSIIKNKATINFQNTGKKVINLDNIVLQKIDNESTKISINTNYTFSTQHALGYYDPKLNQTYSFVSGGYQTINVINPIKGSIPTRTCKSTNFAENAIFKAIK